MIMILKWVKCTHNTHTVFIKQCVCVHACMYTYACVCKTSALLKASILISIRYIMYYAYSKVGFGNGHSVL